MIKGEIYKNINKIYPESKGIDFKVDYPPSSMGDYSINLALKLASSLSQDPMEIANDIVAKIKANKEFSNIFKEINIEHPGFVNFYLNKNFLKHVVKLINMQVEDYGKSEKSMNQKVQVEFISANPTGPLHLGNGRGGFLGDVLANVLDAAGYEVQKEYYVNDIGKQVDILSESVLLKYFHLQGMQVPYPDYCYQGKYIEDLASKLRMYNYTIKGGAKIQEIKKKIRGQVIKLMVKDLQRQTKEIMKIDYDEWFFESSLYDQGLVEKLLKELDEKEATYKQEGALWLKTTEFGDDKDRVLIKENGEQTYFLSDVAYQYNKLKVRNFDKVIHVWGADHHGYINRIKATVDIYDDSKKLDFIIIQLVKLIRDGKELKMSKRSGIFVTIEELIDEVGLDVVRFFFLKYSADTHMDFDLDLALDQSDKNPVFYVQYAHARIASILREVEKQKIKVPKKIVLKFTQGSEIDLMNELIKLPDVLLDISKDYSVHRLPNYVMEVANKFHNFYTQCRVIDNGKLNASRYELIKATKIVIKNVLSLMGITAPEKMEQKSRKPRYLV